MTRFALTIAIGTVLAALIGVVLTLGRGTVGPESVTGKDVADYVQRAAVHADAILSPGTPADPTTLTLPFRLESKRRVKQMLEASGLVAPAPERAMQFTLRQQRGPESVRCLIILRGDHVVGVAVLHTVENSTFAEQVRSALEMQFERYEVQRLQEGA